MSDDSEKKDGHSFLRDVAKTVTAGIIMLVCTTLYNLFLAHIWPVTIHFGEYSLNNFIFILVSIVSSIFLALVILSLEILYIFSSIGMAIVDAITPTEKRKKRKRQWYEPILNAFLLASLAIVNALIWLITLKDRRETDKPTINEETRQALANLPALKQEQKPEQKQKQQQ